MGNSEKIKTWQIVVERPSGHKDTYYINALTLYDAFKEFSEAFFPWNMVALLISEVENDENKRRQKEMPRAGLPGAHQMA